MTRTKKISNLFKFTLLLIMLLLPSGILLAQTGACYAGQVIAPPQPLNNGQPVQGAGVRVCSFLATGTPCNPLASGGIFSDANLTQPLSNPFNSDQNGNYNFCAADGAYMIQISAAPGVTYTLQMFTGFSGTVSCSALPALTGDVTTTSGSCVTTVGKVNGVAYGTNPSTNTVPVVTGSNATTYEAVPNAALANSTVTISGHSIALGGSQNLVSSDVGLGNVTNDVQTKAAIVPNTTPTSGQILVGNAGGTAYAPNSVGGDATLSSSGSVTVTGVNGAAVPTSATVLGSNGSKQLVAASTTGSGTTVVLATSPSIASPAVTGTASGTNTLPVVMLQPGSSGQCLNTSGSTPTWGSCAGTAGVQLIGSPNTTPVTANANSAASQALQNTCASTPCFGAGALNTLGKTVRIRAGGTVTPVNSTENIAMQINFGSGAVTAASPVSNTTAISGWTAEFTCVVTTTGATGTLTCIGFFTFSNNSATVAGVTFASPVTVVTSVNLTGTITPSFAVAFTTASATNTMTSSIALVEQLN